MSRNLKPTGAKAELSFLAIFLAGLFPGDHLVVCIPLGAPDSVQNRLDFNPVLPAAVKDAGQVRLRGQCGSVLVGAVHGIGPVSYTHLLKRIIP